MLIFIVKLQESNSHTFSVNVNQSMRGPCFLFKVCRLFSDCVYHRPIAMKIHPLSSRCDLPNSRTECTHSFFLQTYNASTTSVLPALLSAIRQSPPAVGPPHDGKKIGRDLVTYTYKQVTFSFFLRVRILFLCQQHSCMPAHSYPVVSDCHSGRKRSLSCVSCRQRQAVVNGSLG